MASLKIFMCSNQIVWKNLHIIHLWRLAILFQCKLVTNWTCHFHGVYIITRPVLWLLYKLYLLQLLYLLLDHPDNLQFLYISVQLSSVLAYWWTYKSSSSASEQRTTSSIPPAPACSWRTRSEDVPTRVQHRVQSNTTQQWASTGHKSCQASGCHHSQSSCRSIEVDETAWLSWGQLVHSLTEENNH